jgi:hypothetical protein
MGWPRLYAARCLISSGTPANPPRSASIWKAISDGLKVAHRFFACLFS